MWGGVSSNYEMGEEVHDYWVMVGIEIYLCVCVAVKLCWVGGKDVKSIDEACMVVVGTFLPSEF